MSARCHWFRGLLIIKHGLPLDRLLYFVFDALMNATTQTSNQGSSKPNSGPSSDLDLDECLIVIFGASGDLTKRKLIPALFHLFTEQLMPEHFCVLGISRTKYSDEDFRKHLYDFKASTGSAYDDSVWEAFSQRIHYHPADSTKAADMEGIRGAVQKLAQQHQTGDNLLFYLSMAPSLYEPTIENLGISGMITEGKRWCSINRDKMPWQRIVVEKPFGHDEASAAHLNRVLGRVVEDESVYRIDHYLGKETVQNLMVFRFANAIFEPLWNNVFVDHVQITATETVGVEGRGGYYDSPDGGAMRDMIQSHLLQVMAVVAMDAPVKMDDKSIRMEASKVLTACRQYTKEDTPEVAVRAQYLADNDDPEKKAYRDEPGVDPNSTTDTYAALKVFIDNWRWKNVPFYLRSGKRLAKKQTEIVVYFKPAAHGLFPGKQVQEECDGNPTNQIVINVQPNEGIRLRFEGKVPGLGMKIKPVVMDFDYEREFEATIPDAYAILLLDAIRGDQTNFKQREEIEHAWRVVQPILDYWAENGDKGLEFYESGSWGPAGSDAMLAKQAEGKEPRHWRVP